MRQFKPIPSSVTLAPTLAQRLFQLRELRNLTVRDLSKASRFSIERLEDIEAGIETWLSATDRQLLAKALGVEPLLLKEVETRPELGEGEELLLAREQIRRSILHGQRELSCPRCAKPLRCSVQEGFDELGEPVVLAKAYCTKCPFVL